MQSFEVEIDAMRAAQAKLARLREDLEQHRQLAANASLHDSVPRSTLPVADRVANKMHDVYLGRAGAQAGVQRVLDDYLAELTTIQNTIKVTLEAYDAREREAIAQYQRAMPGEAH